MSCLRGTPQDHLSFVTVELIRLTTEALILCIRENTAVYCRKQSLFMSATFPFVTNNSLATVSM